MKCTSCSCCHRCCHLQSSPVISTAALYHHCCMTIHSGGMSGVHWRCCWTPRSGPSLPRLTWCRPGYYSAAGAHATDHQQRNVVSVSCRCSSTFDTSSAFLPLSALFRHLPSAASHRKNTLGNIFHLIVHNCTFQK